MGYFELFRVDKDKKFPLFSKEQLWDDLFKDYRMLVLEWKLRTRLADDNTGMVAANTDEAKQRWDGAERQLADVHVEDGGWMSTGPGEDQEYSTF